MPAVRSKTLGDRAFMVAAPTLWNSLPKELRAITNVNSFKAHILRLIFLELYIGDQFYIQLLLACIYILLNAIFLKYIIFCLFLVK